MMTGRQLGNSSRIKILSQAVDMETAKELAGSVYGKIMQGIIDNKIKSKINGEHHNIYSDKVQSQLSKYYNHAKDKCPDKNIYCYIFSPDYNSINLEKYETGKYYKTIKYSQIYNFYIKCAGSMLHTNYFSEFIDAIHLHSTKIDQSNYEIMKNRFISRIKNILEIKSLQG